MNWVAFSQVATGGVLTNSPIEDYSKFGFFTWDSLSTVLKYSTMYSVFLIAGALSYKALPDVGHFREIIRKLGRRVKLGHVAVGTGITFVAFVAFVGGFDQIMQSTVSRLGKMHETSLANQIVISFSRMLSASMMVMASLKFASNRNLYSRAFCVLCILVASAQNCYTFSRWAGVGLIVCGGMALLSTGRPRAAASIGLIASGLYLNSVGFNFRNDFDLGLRPFAEASWELLFDRASLNIESFNINFLDYSMVAAEKVTLGLSVSPVEALKIFAVNISPLPSFLVPVRDAGWNIAIEKGWNFGITTSTIVDVYLCCGWWGLTVAFLHGNILSRLYSAALRENALGGALLYMLALSSTVISLHGSARATSRIFWYSLFIILVLNIIAPKRRGAVERGGPILVSTGEANVHVEK